jgi:hypothetical protein
MTAIDDHDDLAEIVLVSEEPHVGVLLELLVNQLWKPPGNIERFREPFQSDMSAMQRLLSRERRLATPTPIIDRDTNGHKSYSQHHKPTDCFH